MERGKRERRKNTPALSFPPPTPPPLNLLSSLSLLNQANVRSYYSRMLDVAAGIVPSTDPPPAPAPPFHPGGGGGSGGGGRGHFHLPWGKAGAPYQGPPGMVPPPPAFMGGGGPPPPGQFGGGGTLPPYPPGPYGPPR